MGIGSVPTPRLRGRLAFGGRVIDQGEPKYLNSPETPIYTKSNLLYHLDRAKEALRQKDFAVLVAGIVMTFIAKRTRFGRYVYAIGGNPEAARRAGVRLPAIRTWCLVLCSATAGFAGILLGSFYYGQYSTNVGDPGQLVLYSVAASVIGGTSLFGGRGKPIHGVLGGLLIGGIAYGVSLMNLGSLSIPLEYILPG